MRFLAVTSVLLLGAAFGIFAGEGPARPQLELIDLALPGNKQRLRMQLSIEGQAPGAAWHEFLDKWFDFFDRDGDGLLSRAEAARMFALPVPGQHTALFDFDKADVNKDGKITPDLMKAFYFRAGFTPVQTVTRPPSLKDLQVADALFRHFGPDEDGRLTAEKLKGFARLLRKLDENEDEVLTTAEVVSLGVDRSLKAAERADCQWMIPDKQQAALPASLLLDIGKGQTLGIKTDGRVLEAPASENGNSSRRFRFGHVLLAFPPPRDDPQKAVAVSCQFIAAQFKNVASSKQWVEKRHVEDDASLQLVADVFAHADRDGDGKLTLAELEQFLSLAQLGTTCCLVLTLDESGRNLFDVLDANGDGRLDLKELHAAAGLLKREDSSKGLLRSDIPLYVRVTVERGFSGTSFGPLPIVALAKPAAAPPAALPAKGPAWFRAMDRNGDGVVSLAEFLGPLELFRQIDLNGDGVISLDEAERADRDLRDSKK